MDETKRNGRKAKQGQAPATVRDQVFPEIARQMETAGRKGVLERWSRLTSPRMSIPARAVRFVRLGLRADRERFGALGAAALFLLLVVTTASLVAVLGLGVGLLLGVLV